MTTSAELGTTRSIQLNDGYDDLAAVRTFCKELIESAFDETQVEELTGSLQLAATEAFVNVIKHGYGDGNDTPVECRGTINNTTLSLDILHRGQEFRPESIPTIEAPQENGMGLFLMEQCVDEVRYSKESDGRQCVTLTLHI